MSNICLVSSNMALCLLIPLWIFLCAFIFFYKRRRWNRGKRIARPCLSAFLEESCALLFFAVRVYQSSQTGSGMEGFYYLAVLIGVAILFASGELDPAPGQTHFLAKIRSRFWSKMIAIEEANGSMPKPKADPPLQSLRE